MSEFLPLILIALALNLAIGFTLGWDASTHRMRARFRREHIERRALAHQVDRLTDELANDQVRVGINTGKEYVVDRVQRTLDDIRHDR